MSRDDYNGYNNMADNHAGQYLIVCASLYFHFNKELAQGDDLMELNRACLRLLFDDIIQMQFTKPQHLDGNLPVIANGDHSVDVYFAIFVQQFYIYKS